MTSPTGGAEAAAAVLDFAVNEAHVPRVVAMADIDNVASVAVMRRLGMRHLVDTRMDERSITVYVTPSGVTDSGALRQPD